MNTQITQENSSLNSIGVINSIHADSNIMGFSELKKWLRHKHPMIFLDRITNYDLGKSLQALLVISGNMDCVDAHFPGRSIFPATNLQQAFCQAAIILFQISTSRLLEDEMAIVGSMNSRFYKACVPGDIVHINIKIERLYGTSLIFSGVALVDNKRVATIKSTIMRLNTKTLGNQLW